MARYICKCGRVVNKSTNADNTGNRDTAGCEGCPYLLPWGPFVHKPGDGYVMDVKGEECRMSPSIDYASTYYGSADDKCTLRIVSLDLDFLEEMQVWINEHAEGQLYGVFSRKNIRGTDYSNNGRYSWSIACAQNKQGMAAKAALIQKFFRPDKSRRDKTPEEEKAHILAAIEAGKAAYQRKKENMEYIISENLKNDCVYAYAANEFWVYDKQACRWYTSGFCREQYEQAKLQCPSLTPEDFLEDDNDYNLLDDYELPRAALDALLEAVKGGKREAAPFEGGSPACSCAGCQREDCTCAGGRDATGRADCTGEQNCAQSGCTYTAKHPINPTQAAPASPADAGAATQSLSAADAASLAADPAPAFDYTGLDDQTVADLHLAEREYAGGKKMAEMGLRRMADAVAIAHDTLCGGCDNLSQAHNNQYSKDTFGAWCDSIGVHRKAAERLLQVSKLMDNSTPREQKVLEELSPSLLYAAAKPSAPAELVQAVKDGDITTHKQFKELEAQLKAERQARERAEQQLADEQQAHQAERESTSAMLREEQQRRQKAEEGRIAAEKDKADARQQAKEAQARGKQDAALVEKLQDILLQRDNKLAEQEAQLGRISFSLEDAGRRIQEQADTIQELEAELDQKDEVIRQQGRQPLEAVAVVDQDEVQRQARLLAEQSLPPVCNLLTLLQSSIQQAWDLSGLAGRHAADEEDESACVLLRQYLLSLLSEISDIAGWEEKA